MMSIDDETLYAVGSGEVGGVRDISFNLVAGDFQVCVCVCVCVGGGGPWGVCGRVRVRGGTAAGDRRRVGVGLTSLPGRR
jgi:hypothetical protein